MPKMYPLKKSVADRRAEEDAMGSPAIGQPENAEDREGIHVHLEHHHLKNMKVGGGLKQGTTVTLHGEGHVHSVESRTGPDGEPRHSAHIILHHGALEHEANQDDERENLRNEIESIHGKSEEAREKRQETRGATRAKSGHELAEKTGG